MTPLHGIPVFVNRSFCPPPLPVRTRTHPRARVARLWRKRYAALTRRHPVYLVPRKCPGYAYHVAGNLVVCPHAKAELDKQVNR